MPISKNQKSEIRNTLFDPKHLNIILKNNLIYLGSRRLLLRLGLSNHCPLSGPGGNTLMMTKGNFSDTTVFTNSLESLLGPAHPHQNVML